jgi:hypothetical protein
MKDEAYFGLDATPNGEDTYIPRVDVKIVRGKTAERQSNGE